MRFHARYLLMAYVVMYFLYSGQDLWCQKFTRDGKLCIETSWHNLIPGKQFVFKKSLIYWQSWYFRWAKTKLLLCLELFEKRQVIVLIFHVYYVFMTQSWESKTFFLLTCPWFYHKVEIIWILSPAAWEAEPLYINLRSWS